jgi:nicotinamide-nucleotide adenylyltransferase
MGREKQALFLGRFQPPHRGHENAIGFILGKHGRLTVAIGSSNRKREKENPFSSRERSFLLKKIISSHKAWKGRVRLAEVPDYERHGDWMDDMLCKFPPEKYEFYTNNRMVHGLFGALGFSVHFNPNFHRLENEGRKIRKRIIEGKSVRKRIPKAIWEWMENRGCKIISDG